MKCLSESPFTPDLLCYRPYGHPGRCMAAFTMGWESWDKPCPAKQLLAYVNRQRREHPFDTQDEAFLKEMRITL